MATFEIPQIVPVPTKNPEPSHPGLEQKFGDTPKPVEITASKKTDDISRHESKHSLDPKQDPKHNVRDKPIEEPKVGGKPPQGPPKK